MTCCPVGLLQLGTDDDRADSLGLGMLLGMLWDAMGPDGLLGNRGELRTVRPRLAVFGFDS
jgi:hypothetical protein